MSKVHETHDYDPWCERAQTIDGAKARYVSDDLPGYDLDMLESDVDRLLRVGENPEKRDRPIIEVQEVLADGGTAYRSM